MSGKRALIRGTAILTITSFVTRFMGFFYRIFLGHTFGEENVGLYQLVFPVYALGISFSCAGTELALSRCVAQENAAGHPEKAKELLKTGLIFTFVLSCILTIFLQHNAHMTAISFLHDSRCEELLILLSYTFPFASIHSCICLYSIHHTASKQVQNLLSASTFCIHLSRLFRHAFPLTASRVLLNILQSIEAVSIPVFLQYSGMSSSLSLQVYGVLTGMALPCILFPSAITNAVSSMLLPTVAEIQEMKEKRRLQAIISKIACSCIFLGCFCCIFLLISGKWIGIFLFKSPLAGSFILTLSWICPFLYTNTVLLGMINGLGKTTFSFIINFLSLCIRIAGVCLFIPIWGINGYLTGLLISQIFLFLCCILRLVIYIKNFS